MTKEKDKESSSVSYTKAGLLNKSKKGTSEKSESPAEPKDAGESEGLPTVSKEKSAERDRKRPVH